MIYKDVNTFQNARKEEDQVDSASGLPLNIANGSISISMGKMLNNVGAAGASISPSLSMPKIPTGLPGLGGAAAATSSTSLAGTATASSSSFTTSASGLTSAIPGSSMLPNGAGAVGDAVNQAGFLSLLWL